MTFILAEAIVWLKIQKLWEQKFQSIQDSSTGQQMLNKFVFFSKICVTLFALFMCYTFTFEDKTDGGEFLEQEQGQTTDRNTQLPVTITINPFLWGH